MNYLERTRILQSNPVLLARHFQYRVETFFKHIIVKGSLGKVIHYAIRVEFQVRGSPHIHSLLWVENAPSLTLFGLGGGTKCPGSNFSGITFEILMIKLQNFHSFPKIY